MPQIAQGSGRQLTSRQEFIEAARGDKRKINKELDALEAKVRGFLFRAKVANLGSRITRIRIDKSIAAYERFLDGTGGVVDYDPRWFLQHPVVRGAETQVHQHFGNWMIGVGKPKRRTSALHQELLRLKDGKRITVREPWEANIEFRNEHKYDDHRLLVRTSNIRGVGELTFARKGNVIEVSGVVTHTIADPFEFTPGRVNNFFGIEKVVHNEMLWLEAHGRAKRFTVRSVWRRRVTMRLRLGKDPVTGKRRITGFVEEPKWSDLQ